MRLNRSLDGTIWATRRHYACSELVRSSRLGLTWVNVAWPMGCPRVKRAPPTLSGGSGSAGWLDCLALPAGVGFEGGGAEGFEPGEELAEPAVVVDPGLVVAVLVDGEPAADGFPGDLAGPLPVRAVQPGRVGVAAAVGAAAAGAPLGDRAGQDHAGGGDGGELGGDLLGFGLVAGGDTHGLRVA